MTMLHVSFAWINYCE